MDSYPKHDWYCFLRCFRPVVCSAKVIHADFRHLVLVSDMFMIKIDDSIQSMIVFMLVGSYRPRQMTYMQFFFCFAENL